MPITSIDLIACLGAMLNWKDNAMLNWKDKALNALKVEMIFVIFLVLF